MIIRVNNFGEQGKWLIAFEYNKSEKKLIKQLEKDLKLKPFSDGYDSFKKLTFSQYIYHGTKKNLLAYLKKNNLEVE